MTSSPRLPFDEPDALDTRIEARDRAARERTVDPRFNVALEASAGTGKTRVLVDRYVNLLKAGVAPGHILAITFTRKAAAEMRERVLSTLRVAAERKELTPTLWRDLRQHAGDIHISTIDAFCLSLLREFPLEADLDPGFSMADDTEIPRLVDDALDRALRIGRALAQDDEHVGLVFAQLTDRRVRTGLAALLGRRLQAPDLLAAYLAKAPRDLSLDTVAARGAERLASVFASMRGGLETFLATGPIEPGFGLMAHEVESLAGAQSGEAPSATVVQRVYSRVLDLFQTQAGEPRKRPKHTKAQFGSEAAFRTHRDLVLGAAPAVVEAYAALRRDLNVLVARGVWRLYRIAETEYRRTLETHAVIDFSEALLRALSMLRQMEEFAQSRYRLESRYHHVLVDEFQDTSRKQWELVSLLVESWGHGAGLAHSGPFPPSIFIVGDRKQSIYGFRSAEVGVMRDAVRHLTGLRPDGDVRRTISKSFRARPALLAFVNDVCHDVERTTRDDGFRYEEDDRFPVGGAAASSTPASSTGALGLIVGDTPEQCAARTAAEVARLLRTDTTVRDRDTGLDRPVRAADIAILFRTRDSHREFEQALDRVGVATFVYKGLGFFDAPEVKDVLALLWFLADPTSDLRVAAWLRSRFVRLSDVALVRLAPRLADAVLRGAPAARYALDPDDIDALETARGMASRWLPLVDVIPPAELLDLAISESAYLIETRGPHHRQARENLKKLRERIRRMQNRGYATLGRVVAHVDRLALGDEANATIDAGDAVSLMTVHASKGLEFPVVFLVNLTRGAGGVRAPMRVAAVPPPQEVAVGVGSFASEADEDEEPRAREESKRLLYVALTRARDRLYLSAVLKDGRVAPGRGSLAEVMPATLLRAFEHAAVGAPRAVVEWVASSGVSHAAVIGADDGALVDPPVHEAAVQTAGKAAHDFELAPAWPLVARTVAGPEQGVANTGHHGGDVGASSSRLLGTLVHRLLERVGVGSTLDDGQLASIVGRLIREDERVESADPAAFAGTVVDAYRRLSRAPEVAYLYRSGETLHEVPFTLTTAAGHVRGTIDCLIRRPEGGLLVLEFKTGRPRPEHREQAELYAAAVRAVCPGEPVDARVVYAGA